jgi:hypothetical protein
MIALVPIIISYNSHMWGSINQCQNMTNSYMWIICHYLIWPHPLPYAILLTTYYRWICSLFQANCINSLWLTDCKHSPHPYHNWWLQAYTSSCVDLHRTFNQVLLLKPLFSKFSFIRLFNIFYTFKT